ncbi:hypothetical protein OZN62_00985 [Aurantiacibacter sp. MUD11]|uniref:hypothetical protein n=1 Tax=Aurantiacibacter sp. MUD11 TaxID=3003265 RepID=UPI0022AAF74F|nr:hypothetical protein [Aurantiacibacter sp. MUD11]WAT18184.1 hypothetical protein OZN62_00985 [Aurantiacibacter sp. MUD11]
MTGFASMLGFLALVPAMSGPLGVAEAPAGEATYTASLCNGGSLVIALGGDRAPAPATLPCCAKGCPSRDRRKRIDPEQ